MRFSAVKTMCPKLLHKPRMVRCGSLSERNRASDARAACGDESFLRREVSMGPTSRNIGYAKMQRFPGVNRAVNDGAATHRRVGRSKLSQRGR